MKNNLIITVSREFGSGGREIGEKLAMELGIPYYDKAIIDKTAKETGFCAEIIEKEEQRVTSSLLFNLATNSYTFGNMMSHYGQSLSDQVFQAEAKVIKNLAAEGSCVIVGRCADYILKNQFPCFNVFICADFEKRCERAVRKYGVNKDDVNDIVKKTDKARIRHNQFYGSQDWGDARNYDVTINSGTVGIDNAVAILKAAIENYK